MIRVVFTIAFVFVSNQVAGSTEDTAHVKKSTIPPKVLNIIYPKTLPSLVEDVYYPLILLDTALKRSGYKYKLTAAPKLLGQNRVLKEIEHGGDIDVTWTMTNKVREDKLLPVRVPIFKGLFGWRLMFTTEPKLPYLSRLKTLDDLKKVYFVQGQDWPDTQILRDNGLVISTSGNFDSLFVMLDRGRGDLFPRSVLEIEDELAVFKQQMPLVVLPHLMLKYTSPIYFFFNKDNTAVAKAVNKGLRIMIESGEFDEIFFKYNGKLIENAHIHDKIIVELENKELPPLTPVGDKSLWLPIQKVK